APLRQTSEGGFFMKALGTTILLAVVLSGSGGLFAAEKGKSRNGSDTQWYADPDRGWIRSDERRDRKEDRRDSSKDRRSNQRDRDKGHKGKSRGSSDH
ncbi:MAG: hypothetical protein ACREQW_25735, partial [Candidatus Binatia bacterium]